MSEHLDKFKEQLQDQRQKLEFVLFLTNNLIGSWASSSAFYKNLSLRSFNNLQSPGFEKFERWDLIQKYNEIGNVINLKNYSLLSLSKIQYKNTETWLKFCPDVISESNFYLEFEEFVRILDWFLTEIISYHSINNLTDLKSRKASIFGLFHKLNRYFKSISKFLEYNDLELIQSIFKTVNDLCIYENPAIFETSFPIVQENITKDSTVYFKNFDYTKLDFRQKIKFISDIKYHLISVFATLDNDFRYYLLEKVGNKSLFQKYNWFIESVSLFCSKLICYYNSTGEQDTQILVLSDEIRIISQEILYFVSDKERQVIQDCLSICDLVYDFKPKIMSFRDSWLE